MTTIKHAGSRKPETLLRTGTEPSTSEVQAQQFEGQSFEGRSVTAELFRSGVSRHGDSASSIQIN